METLGRYILTGIKSMHKHEPRIQVCITIKEDGLIRICAMDFDSQSIIENIIPDQLSFTSPVNSVLKKMTLRRRIDLLINELTELTAILGEQIDEVMELEIDMAKERAKYFRSIGSILDMRESCLIMGTLLCELEALVSIKEKYR